VRELTHQKTKAGGTNLLLTFRTHPHIILDEMASKRIDYLFFIAILSSMKIKPFQFQAFFCEGNS